MMERQRGFSLIEVLAALLVLAIVITTTMAMFVERQKRMQAANETILAYQAIANEIEYRRRVPYAELDQLVRALAIAVEPIALINRAFVPLHAEPLQRADDLLRVMLPRALDVGVFDAQQHRAAVPPRVQQVEDRRARAADVQVSGGRWGEAEFHSVDE